MLTSKAFNGKKKTLQWEDLPGLSLSESMLFCYHDEAISCLLGACKAFD